MKNSRYTIATLGSHSALQILKGAHDEGFKTLLITTPSRKEFYQRFPFIDQVLVIESFSRFPEAEKKLKNKNIIIIPHGSFVAYFGVEGNKKMTLPYFGNKKVLDFEADRKKQGSWLRSSGIKVPKEFATIGEAEFPVIVKSYGAAGGAGYFLSSSKKDFKSKIKNFDGEKYLIQQYLVGVPLYIHYFYSPLTNKIEIMSMDRRYETNADAIGRIPSRYQRDVRIEPSFVVVGNSPLVLRESLLPEAFRMGEQVVAESKKKIDNRGLFGPFCLETIITPGQEIYTIEISARIVAGTNLFIEGSPYSSLFYKEPMSTGRRIAREIKLGIENHKLELMLD
ncbi:formate--phosphoribosylaminoimidazolecarboxamide ligase [Patescibacteria group bacterium]|nr:formate--phosphoribosylaminoimidazolecarboxamide ligase [Patescibacteria group bacterium]